MKLSTRSLPQLINLKIEGHEWIILGEIVLTKQFPAVDSRWPWLPSLTEPEKGSLELSGRIIEENDL